MIVCPNCNHQNPEGAVQCEACYTPLPATVNCSNCGATVQTDANFCGQCGFNLRTNTPLPSVDETSMPSFVGAAMPGSSSSVQPDLEPDLFTTNFQEPGGNELGNSFSAAPLPASLGKELPPPVASDFPVPPPVASNNSNTRLQQQTAKLLHLRTDTTLELPPHLSLIHIGKWNDRIPPDIDLSGFPDSEIVSRIHADIRVEGDAFYIEDVGSSNGTYVNNLLLPLGNRHRLRSGDRISLGKGDRVTFLFQIS
uniref:FHA domain-containing protein n=1 Tax=Trichocoleus desertorum TaxID=1481672 RepID=UPI0025B29E11|nr:FHA domain-containing protein [Trichocoleus desertorum]